MKNTIFKKSFIIFIAIFILVSSFSVGYATTLQEQINEGESRLTEGTDPVSESLQQLANVLMGGALAISVLKLAQIGLQMMLSSGKKSKAKESLIPWAIGVFVCGTYLIIGPWIMHLFDPIEGKGPFDVSWF